MLEPWRWREVKELNGLGVLCLDQAPDGTYWFGGIGTITRYDGMEVSTIPFDEDFLSRVTRIQPRPRVRSLLMLDNDRPLAVIGGSLVLRDHGVWKIIIQNIGFTHFETRMEKSEDGSIWLLTHDALWHIREDLAEGRKVATTAGNAHFTAFCIGPSGTIWLAQNTPQQRADLIQIPVRDGRAAQEIQWILRRIPVEQSGDEAGLAIGGDGRIWYADNIGKNGLYAFNPESNTWDDAIWENKNRNFFSMNSVKNGTVWAGGNGFLLAIRQGKTGFYSREKLVLPAVPLQLMETRDERWWIIGRIGHVYYLDRGYTQWKTYLGLHFQCETEQGEEWFLADNGRVVSHDPRTDTWLQYGLDDGLLESARSITCSSHGLIWVAGRHRGRAAISVFDGEKWTRLLHPEFAESIERNRVWESAKGTLWFTAGGQILDKPAKAGGVLKYGINTSGDPELLGHYAPPVVPYHAKSMGQTSDGTIWFGAPTVRRWSVGAVKASPVLDIPLTTTLGLVIDGDDSVWVAKLGSGLYRKRTGNAWEWMTKNDGLENDHVSDLLALEDGTILAASDKGISRFDGQSWAEHIFSQDFAMANDGGTMRQATDGALWFNYTDLDPRSPRVLMNATERYCTIRYMPERKPPDTELIQYSKEVSPPGNVHISWAGRDPFAQTPSDRLQFSWRYNGGVWSPFSAERGRTFLKLADGEYNFEVRARDSDFNMDLTPARISFAVLPPVWKQSWFVFLIVMLFGLLGLLIWVFIRYREHRLRFEKKQMEQQVSHMAEMDRLKSGFFTNISHELNTPLMLVMGPLERILKKEQDESKQTLLNQAMRNVERVANLTSQLMDFRRLETGKLTLDFHAGDAAQIVRETVELMKPLAAIKQVQCNFQGLEVLHGLMDEDKLRKIVQNLVGNAIKYTPPGGTVDIHLSSATETHELILIIEDTGPGIEPEHLEHIFERFYRVPEKKIVDGSGIGLNLTKELVELWGGRMTAESPAREHAQHPGSRFMVWLPLDLNGSENLEINDA